MPVFEHGRTGFSANVGCAVEPRDLGVGSARLMRAWCVPRESERGFILRVGYAAGTEPSTGHE